MPRHRLRPSPLCVLLAAVLATGTAHSADLSGGPSRLTLDQVFPDDASGHHPSQLAWTKDGRTLSYLWKDEKGEALWALDAASGETRPLLRPGDLGVEGFSIDQYLWSPRGDSLLLASHGDLYLYDLAAARLRRLTDTPDPEKLPTFSPDGSQVAYVRNANLHLFDLAAGHERDLTRDGEPEVTLEGITDWVYWEEIWNRATTGYWWSPDGRAIAFYRFDETPVTKHPLVDFLPPDPTVEWQRYPRAGEANPRVAVGVLEVASGRTTWLATGSEDDSYLARVDWTPRGDGIAVQRLDRAQDRLDLLLCSPADGHCVPLLSERSPTWINLGDDFHFLPDGGFVWGSERSGWRQLYRYDRSGRLVRPLTTAAGAVTSLDAVDGERGFLVYTRFGGGRLGAAERQVVRQRLDGGAPVALTAEQGWHSALVAEATGNWVETASDADHPPVETVRAADGRKIAELPATPPPYDPASLPRWELFTLRDAAGTELPARILKPAGFDPARRYPAIVYQYGGPGSQVVVDRWGGRDLWHKMMAERGYVVFSLDNPGSTSFGKAGEDRMHLRFGPINLAAQLAGVEHLKSLPWVDPARIGLWGWSGGGSNTLYCLLHAPGTWHAGVAGAPVTDWRLYDSIWTERYLGRPEDNADGYRDSSAVEAAAALADRLLIVHGTSDDNVHPQNSLLMAEKLIAAGRLFEQAFYPRQKHGLTNPAMRHFYARMTDFFDRTLGEPGER